MKIYTLDGRFIEETDNFVANFTGIIEYVNGTKIWGLEGKYHRLDGPAYIDPNGTKEWYVDGKQITKEQCEFLYSIIQLKGLI